MTRRRGRAALLGFGMAWIAVAGGCAALQWGDDDSMVAAGVHAFAGAAWVAPLGLAIVGSLGRHRLKGLAALPLLAWTIAWTYGGRPATGGPAQADARVLTANLLMVNPDHGPLLAELVAQDPDVMVLQEVSHAWGATLQGDPRLAPWPHRTIVPQDGSFGLAVLSKEPVAVQVHDLLGVPMAQVELRVAGARVDLYNIHTLPPRSEAYAATWHRQMAMLADRAQSSEVPVILAGDFNATRHHPSFRRLLAGGLRDAHHEVGRGAAKTWPNGLFPVPSLGLDHVLVGPGIHVLHVHEAPAHGSDHNPVIVDVALGIGPTG